MRATLTTGWSYDYRPIVARSGLLGCSFAGDKTAPKHARSWTTLKVKKIALGLTAAVALAGFAVPHSASAKSISQIAVGCSGPTSAYAIFMERGSEVTLGFGVNQGASVVGLWHVQIIDNGTNTIIDAPMNATTSGPWGMSTTHTLPRGFHVVSITADNQTTGESCQSTLSFKN